MQATTVGRMPGRGRALSPEEAVAVVLRELRLERGLSQEELGFRLDSGRTYISELERGVRVPTLRWLFRLTRDLEIKPSEFLRRVERLSAGAWSR